MKWIQGILVPLLQETIEMQLLKSFRTQNNINTRLLLVVQVVASSDYHEYDLIVKAVDGEKLNFVGVHSNADQETKLRWLV